MPRFCSLILEPSSTLRSLMIKPIPALVAIALVAVSCSHGVSRIQTRSLPTPNPTTYSFPLPLEEVHTRALEAFSSKHQTDKPMFARSRSTMDLASVFSAECSTNAINGTAVFRDPGNSHDIYLHTFHTPFVLSSVYRGREGGLPFIATFHLHLTRSSSDTVVTVTASDTEVVNGTKFGMGSCGPGQKWNCKRVRPTTVEEYTVLRYLGRALGATNMPDLILPAQ